MEMKEINVSEDWFEKASREAGLMRSVFCGEPVCYKNHRGHICGVIKEGKHYYYCFKDGDESLSIVSHEEMRKIVQKKTLIF